MSSDPPADRRIIMCRILIRIRKVLGDSLGFALCPSPIWDMLLDLYAAHHEKRDMYLWPLCMAANTPFSTAHRKIGEMEREGLVVRDMTARDRRRIGIRMTEQGLTRVGTLLDRIDAICHGAATGPDAKLIGPDP